MRTLRNILLIISCFVVTVVIFLFLLRKPKQISQRHTLHWKDDFNSLDYSFWNVPHRQALEGEYKNVHVGYFKKKNVSVHDGYLVLSLTQEKGQAEANPNGVISEGAEIQSKKTYGYGIYEWRMRMSSTSPDPKKTGDTVSGQISAGFNFINNSQTEIDFEVEGQYPNQLEMTTWKNPDTSHFPNENDRTYTFKKIQNMATQFHTYKYIWKPQEITYYVDNNLVATHKEHIPEKPAYFMINHWGTDSTNFGGEATLGVSRYILVDWVSYTSL